MNIQYRSFQSCSCCTVHQWPDLFYLASKIPIHMKRCFPVDFLSESNISMMTSKWSHCEWQSDYLSHMSLGLACSTLR